MLTMCNVKIEHKKFVMQKKEKKTKSIFLCHTKMKLYSFMTHDYISGASRQ